jgi:hypothetical protein
MVSNADRLLIMSKLRDQKKNNLSKLAKELGLVVYAIGKSDIACLYYNRLLEGEKNIQVCFLSV